MITTLILLAILLIVAGILMLIIIKMTVGRKEKTVFFGNFQELKKQLDEAETGFREILGMRKEAPVREMKNIKWTVAACKKKEELQSIIKGLEEKIFKKESVKNMFYYILNSSVSRKGVKSYKISLDEYLNLPEIFARYFIKLPQGRYELSYLTPERIRGTLFKTLSYLRMHPTSRHGYIPIWDCGDNNILTDKVPSLLGFYLLKSVYMDKWDFNVIIRSCDIEFLLYDAWFFLSIAEFCMEQFNHFPTDGIAVTLMIMNLHEYM